MKNTTVAEFKKLKRGDEFWISGIKHIAVADTDFCGVAAYNDELVVYDEEGDGYFEEDFVRDGEHGMSKERALYIAGRALGELIYGDGWDADEMKEWVKNEFDMTDDELAELGVE